MSREEAVPATLVGNKAPDFTVPAVLGDGTIVDNFTFSKATEGKYAVVFFYPLDFTFVCPSELIALNHRMDRFRKKGVEVISVSIDSHFTHNAWRKTPESEGGIGPVSYTMAADMSHEVSKAYGVESQGGMSFRGTFIIDNKGIVRVQLVNDLPIGRDIDEIIRLVDAVQYHEKNGEVCPAGWKEGDTAMQADPEGVAKYLANNANSL